MLIEDIKNIKSGKKELRQFGITMGIVLLLMGPFLWWRGREWYPYVIVIALAFFVLGLVLPALLKPLHKLWMTLALVLGWCVTGVIMMVVFYLVVTPLSLVARWCGKDFLHTKFEKDAQSYWIPKENITRDKKTYENQF